MTECQCGCRTFRKIGVISCSSVPPFLRCSACHKLLVQKMALVLVGFDGQHYRTCEGFFTQDPTCVVCNASTDGNKHVYETQDELGNPMWIAYSLCEGHEKIDWDGFESPSVRSTQA